LKKLNQLYRRKRSGDPEREKAKRFRLDNLTLICSSISYLTFQFNITIYHYLQSESEDDSVSEASLSKEPSTGEL
jgi:hypothetical protein